MVHATRDVATVREVTLAPGATVLQAIEAAALGASVDRHGGVAVWGHPVAPDAPLREGDRVELLRPLAVDPKLARQRRVEHRRREDAVKRRGT